MLQSLTAWNSWKGNREWLYSKQGVRVLTFDACSVKALNVVPELLIMSVNQGLTLCMSSEEIPDLPEEFRACRCAISLILHKAQCVLAAEVLYHLYTELKADTHLLKTLCVVRAELETVLAQTLQMHLALRWHDALTVTKRC